MAMGQMLIPLIIAVLLLLLMKPKANTSKTSASASATTITTPISESTRAIVRAQEPSPLKREVTCQECLNPKPNPGPSPIQVPVPVQVPVTVAPVPKCNDCLLEPGMSCLQKHFDVKNVRASSWMDLFNRLNEISEKIVNIVELGTSEMGEKSCIDKGCSTVLFGQWVKNRNELYSSRKNIAMSKLYSVDSKKEKIEKAKEVYSKYPKVIENIQFLHEEKAVADFITRFDKPIDILYINQDQGQVQGQGQVPEKATLEVKRMHLSEIRAALPKLSKHAFVIIDNIQFGHGDLVIQELATRGFKILSDDYQAIITKPVITDSVKNEISRMSEWMAESKKL